MSVSFYNGRRGQSLVAYGTVRNSSSKINVFLLRLNELTDGEMQIFRGTEFQICGAA